MRSIKITHADLKKAVVDYLRVRKWLVIPIHQSLGSYRGIFDLCAMKKGKCVWVEIKVGRDKLSKYQEQFLYDLQDHNIQALIIRDMDDVKQRLDVLEMAFQ